jgi:hypothetical protein
LPLNLLLRAIEEQLREERRGSVDGRQTYTIPVIGKAIVAPT